MTNEMFDALLNTSTEELERITIERAENAFGYAEQSASVQYFLDTCEAVKEWKEHTNCEGTEYFVFRYDPNIEVAIVPASVEFAGEAGWEQAREATN